MKVGQLMTRQVVTVPRDARIHRAELDMKLAEVRHLPVVERDGHLIGVLSHRDLRNLNPRDPLEVQDLMHGPPITVRADDDAAAAAAVLIEKKIGCLPVVDADQRIVGILTATDFLNVAFQALSHVPLRGRTPAA